MIGQTAWFSYVVIKLIISQTIKKCDVKTKLNTQPRKNVLILVIIVRNKLIPDQNMWSVSSCCCTFCPKAKINSVKCHLNSENEQIFTCKRLCTELIEHLSIQIKHGIDKVSVDRLPDWLIRFSLVPVQVAPKNLQLSTTKRQRQRNKKKRRSSNEREKI